jgi:hypothetical protein
MGWFGGKKPDERVAAAAHINAFLNEFATHDAARCGWQQTGGVCGAVRQGQKIECEFQQNPYDHVQYMALFNRKGQGVVGQWFLRMWGGGEPELGMIWHLISVQFDYLLDPTKKWPKAVWSPNLKNPVGFQLLNEPTWEGRTLSNWEGGQEPFAQFVLFR